MKNPPLFPIISLLLMAAGLAVVLGLGRRLIQKTRVLATN
jgi:hypothetical protein